MVYHVLSGPKLTTILYTIYGLYILNDKGHMPSTI